MSAEEIQFISKSIALHPIFAVGGLLVLISIARRINIKHKEELETSKRLIKTSSEN